VPRPDPSQAAPRVLSLHGTPLPVVGRARLYVCGITPYDTTHLGHASTFVWTDTAVRVLRATGVEVDVCRNVTDLDDDMLAAARAADVRYDRLAALQQFDFERDMTALGVRTPAHEPRARTYVPQVIALAAALLAGGSAYERDGSVYFRGAEVAARAGLDREAALAAAGAAGGRVDDPAKDDPLDVAVWQASEGDLDAGAGGGGVVAWPSPWGPGRPGWHAECAAMALTVLGPALDLHTGGADLRFPHHAYEAAQAEAVTGVHPFARAWMHVGTVGVGGAKMAKSTGNLVLVSEVLTTARPAALRLALLDRRWDADWQWTPEVLALAEQRLDALYAAAARPDASRAAAEEVLAALLDDLDVPRALDAATGAGGQPARSAVSLLGLPKRRR